MKRVLKPRINPKCVKVYNVEEYLCECLESVVNQTLRDMEIICINDGSTDGSRDILGKYAQKDTRIQIIDKQNTGCGHSMNTGLNEANGEYIGIVEPDDFIKPAMFKELYDLALKYNLDMVKSDSYRYIGKTKQARIEEKIKKKICGKVLSVKDDASILKITPSVWSAIYKREFLNENNVRFLETPGASYQDTSFSFKTFVSAERLMFTDKPYYCYRYDNSNSSVHSRAKVYALCDEWEEITKYVNKNSEIKKTVNDIKLLVQFNAYRGNAVRIESRFRDEFIDRFSRIFQEYFKNNEIQYGFYKKVSKRELQLLLNDKTAYRELIEDLAIKHEQSGNRRKKFSIRINSQRISILLFGKQVLEIKL